MAEQLALLMAMLHCKNGECIHGKCKLSVDPTLVCLGKINCMEWGHRHTPVGSFVSSGQLVGFGEGGEGQGPLRQFAWHMHTCSWEITWGTCIAHVGAERDALNKNVAFVGTGLGCRTFESCGEAW